MSINTSSLTVKVAGALLVVSLSACTIQPISPDSPLAGTTEKLGYASEKFWNRALHVLRLDGSDTTQAGSEQPLDVAADDDFGTSIDIALLDDTDSMQALQDQQGDVVVLSPVADTDGIVNVAADDLQRDLHGADTTLDDPLLVQLEELEELQPLPASESLESPQQSVVAVSEPAATLPATEDYQHLVSENETLWDLAKQFTGDATNWRVLAELNNLDANGSVYPGMELKIPADMLKQNQLLPVSSEPTLAANDGQRINIEQSDAVEAVTEVVAVNTGSMEGPTTSFAVQAGETLWDLAKRTTGDATNWKAIASANNMDDRRAANIRFGESIEVPDAMLKTVEQPVLAAQEPVETEQLPALAAAEAAPAVTPQITEVASTGDAVQSEAADTQEIRILDANFKSEPLQVDETQPVAATETTAQTITVSGTYYPKAVYNDANFSASLLMRVSPGTKLEVSRIIGPWYEVKTKQGTGFVHSRDIK